MSGPRRLFAAFAIGFSVFGLPAVQAEPTPDYAREQRLAEEVVDAIIDGDALFLEIGDREVLAIYTETDRDPRRGAVIILHGRGYHPDWPDVAQPLRTALAEAGWNTLSVQMPVLEKTAKFYDYVPLFPFAAPRIDAAIDYLQDQDIDNIILIAHSCGTHMAMHWIEQKGDARINGYVGIGMGATDYQQPMKGSFPLAGMKIPVLDVYGSEDYPAVQRMAPERLQMMRDAGHPQSRQVVVEGANHYFTDAGAPLVETVSDWLDGLEQGG